MYIHLIIVLVFLSIFGFTVGDFLHEYFSTTGTIREKIFVAGKCSLTILWTRVCYLAGSSIGILAAIADYFNAPGVTDAINKIMQPQYVALIGLAVAIITEIARRQTLVIPPK